MRSLVATVPLVLIALVAAGPVAAQPESPAGPTAVAGVDVVARPRPTPATPRAVAAFVGGVTRESIVDQAPTWRRAPTVSATDLDMYGGANDHGVCPVVIGLPAAYAAFITGRIRAVGVAAGAPMARSARCAVNAQILFPIDAKAYIAKLARDRPTVFGFRYHGQLLESLAKPLEPISIWYATRVSGTGGPSSRVKPPHVSAIASVLIVVDTSRTQSLDMGQLADFLAMVTLAEVRPGSAPAGLTTILNLFVDLDAGRPPMPGLTDWDAAYLKALYAISDDLPGATQKALIGQRIRAALSPP